MSDLVCFSHLRWDFVFQRPQHLLGRAARGMRVVFWEEPLLFDGGVARVAMRQTAEGVTVVQPHLPRGGDEAGQRALLDATLAELGVERPVLWYYTPRALEFSGHLDASAVVYDCMDELSAFAEADPALPGLERALMARADVVFTGGQSLYEAKRGLHPSVHCFPSGVDVGHFRPARGAVAEVAEQAGIGRPRAGFFGVIDERLDLGLIAEVARLLQAVQFVMVGPVVKIKEASLPRGANLHWLGGAGYDELPGLIGHWDVALMPFAMNEATRFISPTKTPEYLAAGRAVVSTPIADVVRRYGGLAGVRIAGDAAGFAAAIGEALALAPGSWWGEADAVLEDMSWDATWAKMEALIVGVLRG